MIGGLRSLLLKYSPEIYEFGRKSYWIWRRGLDRLRGTTRIHERYWARRGAVSDTDWKHQFNGVNWIEDYWKSVDHPHRKWLLDSMASFSPLGSALEIGCNCGPNLRLLSKSFPEARLTGVDINKEAVDQGRQLLVHEGLDNIELFEGMADDLSCFSDACFDVVFTDAVLIYIGPDKIDHTVREMLRVARRGIVLLEWGVETPERDNQGKGEYYKGLWKRNYTELFRRFAPQARIETTGIPREAWPDSSWHNWGRLVKVWLHTCES